MLVWIRKYRVALGLVLCMVLATGCGALRDYRAEAEHREHDSIKCQEELGWEKDTQGYHDCMEREREARAEPNGSMPDSFLDGGWWIGTWF